MAPPPRAAADSALADESVHCVVVSGAGKFFSNGMDLKWIELHLGEEADQLQRDTERLLGAPPAPASTSPAPPLARPLPLARVHALPLSRSQMRAALPRPPQPSTHTRTHASAAARSAHRRVSFADHRVHQRPLHGRGGHARPGL